MCLRVSYRKKYELLSHNRKESDPELDLERDQLVRGADPGPDQNFTDPQH